MSEYLTFGTGLLLASVFWFALFSYGIVSFSTKVYEGINLHMKKIRDGAAIAARHMDHPEGTEAINDILASARRCSAEDI